MLMNVLIIVEEAHAPTDVLIEMALTLVPVVMDIV